MSAVTVYDPNSINPYGLELSALLSSRGYDVYFAHARVETSRDRERFDRLDRLPGPAGGTKFRVKYLIQRLVAPLRVLRATPLSVPLIVVWTREPWDGILFTLRAIVGGRTFFIYHNPTPGRRRSGVAGWAESLLSRFATNCVHSKWLATHISGNAKVEITPHPPYRVTSDAHLSGPNGLGVQHRSERELSRVGYIGALRIDKGCDDLPKISANSCDRWVLHIIGSDKLSEELSTRERRSREVTYASAGEPLSDAEMMDAIRSCALIIAPYIGVTESGSVRLAQSVGVPVLGYRSPGLEHVLTEKALVDSPEALGTAISRFLIDPWETFIDTPEAQEAKCANAWQEALK